MIELKITKVPAMTQDGRFSLAPEDVESVRMQILKYDARNTLEGYADVYCEFQDEYTKSLHQRILAMLEDDALLDAFIKRMDDGVCWSMADLILSYNSSAASDFENYVEMSIRELLEEDDG